MLQHHKNTIQRITNKLKAREDILGILVCGSIAHGFETPTSDVDLMLVLSDSNHKKRLETGDIHYFETESCTYDSGYIDGKYISRAFMKQVVEQGSEPARFAFKGAFTTYSRVEGVSELINEITRYPMKKKNENITRFYAQFEAWKWYCEEALKQNNLYLLNHSISNFVLFSGRLILAYNEKLYPYHKWFLKVLEQVKEKPDDLMAAIQILLNEPNKEHINKLYQLIKDFRNWEVSEHNWPVMFMKDSDLNWMTGCVPIADI